MNCTAVVGPDCDANHPMFCDCFRDHMAICLISTNCLNRFGTSPSRRESISAAIAIATNCGQSPIPNPFIEVVCSDVPVAEVPDPGLFPGFPGIGDAL